MDASGARNIQTQSNVKTERLNPSCPYSQVTQEEIRLKREHAVVTDAIDGIPIKDYATAIAKIVGGRNIVSISRTSNSRVCLYLKFQETADKLTEHERYVNVNKNKLEMRPLLAKTKRIIISNIQTVILNIAIERKIQEFNVNLTF